MIEIELFESIDDLKKFMYEKQLNGVPFNVVKFVVTYNPFMRQREYHLMWSRDARMKQGQHLNHAAQRRG